MRRAGPERAKSATTRAAAFVAARARALASVLAVAASLGVSMPAGAQAPAYNAYLCNDLQARLAVASKTAPSKADRWSAAIAEQRAAIATNQAQLSRCGGAGDPRCGPLVMRGEQMSANLSKLEREYGRIGGGSENPEKARIQAAMMQAGCFNRGASQAKVSGDTPPGLSAGSGQPVRGMGTAPVQAQSKPERPRSFFSVLFGEREREEASPGDEQTMEPIDPALLEQMSGTYRTLCVRTCDGFFFPISFQASRGRLKTDANVCSALCPGTETRLFYHGAGQEAEGAVAADSGEPITKLPNAFLYRTKVVPGCACGRPDPRLLPAAAGGLAGRVRDMARFIDPASLPLPKPRPTPDQDPETQASQISGLDPQPVEPIRLMSESEGGEKLAEGGEPMPRVVRTVGPKWLSDR